MSIHHITNDLHRLQELHNGATLALDPILQPDRARGETEALGMLAEAELLIKELLTRAAASQRAAESYGYACSIN